MQQPKNFYENKKNLDSLKKIQYLKFLFRVFEYPSLTESPETIHTASFSHLVELFEIEKHMPAKMAYKLSQRALSPGPIDRQNVQLTHAIFNDSTVQALEFYGRHGHPTFLDTARFLKIILKWWKTVNTKTSFTAELRRDTDLTVITVENIIEKTSFLRAFVDWLSEWEFLKLNQNSGGLSKETFAAARHSSACIADLSEFLIETKQFKYFAPGKSQSDPLEGKFGQYRQMCGGNMYASVRQFVESERTLRVKNLSQLNLSIGGIKDIFLTSKGTKNSTREKISKEIFLCLKTENKLSTFFEMPESDRNCIFYIAGCFGRQISTSKSCDCCKKIFIHTETTTVLSDESGTNFLSDDSSDYLKQVNRGGLSIPSELNFNFCSYAWMLYTNIMKNDTLEKMLHSPNMSSRLIFSDILFMYLNDSEERGHFLRLKCSKGHSMFETFQILAQKIFNLFSKNFVSVKNSEIQQKKKRLFPPEVKRDALAAKISKLQSQNLN